MAFSSFEDLDVWKKAMRLSVDVYNELKHSTEYALRDQILRSSVSVPSNIAEGIERFSKKESIRFLNIAMGSCAELRTQLYIAQETGVLSKQKAKTSINEAKEISAMLYGLIRHIRNTGDDNTVKETITQYLASEH